jgi:hypothetical protein
VREYFTTWLWYQDRLCSLSSRCLAGLSVICLAGLGTLGWALRQFLDDLAFLISENDAKSIFVVLEILLVSSAATWVLSCCLGALGRRLMLWLRGL